MLNYIGLFLLLYFIIIIFYFQCVTHFNVAGQGGAGFKLDSLNVSITMHCSFKMLILDKKMFLDNTVKS